MPPGGRGRRPISGWGRLPPWGHNSSACGEREHGSPRDPSGSCRRPPVPLPLSSSVTPSSSPAGHPAGRALPYWAPLQLEAVVRTPQGFPEPDHRFVLQHRCCFPRPSCGPSTGVQLGFQLRGHPWPSKGERRLPATQLSAGQGGNRLQIFRGQEQRSLSPRGWTAQRLEEAPDPSCVVCGSIKAVLAAWGQPCPGGSGAVCLGPRGDPGWHWSGT